MKYLNINFSYLNKYFKNFFLFENAEDNIIKWGRWCAPHMKNCCQKVIDKKVDFAMSDNNLDISKIKFNNK